MVAWVSGVAILAGLPLVMLLELFLHELGHAVPVLLAGGRAHITIGSHDGRTTTVGPLTVTVGTDGLKNTFRYGSIDWRGVESRYINALGIVGGPLVTLLLMLGTVALLIRGVDGVVYGALLFLLFWLLNRAYYTIVPTTYSGGPYGGTASDGKRLLELLRS